MRNAIVPTSFLRRVWWADAAVSAVVGAVMAGAAGPLGELIALPARLLAALKGAYNLYFLPQERLLGGLFRWRLRRTLGSLLEAQPYRIVPSVHATVLLPEAGPAIPGSSAPVVAAR